MKSNFFTVVLIGLVLSSCASRIDTNIKQKYETKPQISLNAASVLTRYDFNPTVKTTGADQLFSRILVQGLEGWISHRLHPAGQGGVAKITVRDASIIGIPNYSNPQKLEASLDVIISILDDKGRVITQAETSIKRQTNAPRNMTDVERKELYQVLTVNVIDTFDSQMENEILKMMSIINIS
jgi:hypothetical protein